MEKKIASRSPARPPRPASWSSGMGLHALATTAMLSPSFPPQAQAGLPVKPFRQRRAALPSSLPRLACNSSPCDGDASPFRPPQDAVLEAISEVSRAEGRIAQTTNIIMGGTISGQSADEWRILDEKVNTYPTRRGFTVIGTGGDDFVQAMVGAVESVLQCPIPEDGIRLNLSSKGKYVSVKIGPVEVDSSEQVQAVYNAMRRDVRMKYFL